MDADKKQPFAWEPLTPPGVAKFAHARLANLLFVQFIFSLFAAVAVVWFLQDSVFPVVRTAIKNLPDAGEIRSAKLAWRGNSPVMLAEGRFLALDVDLDHLSGMDSTADLQIEFGSDSVWTYELFGYLEFPYPTGVILAFNRTELEPLWGAWKAEILFGAVVLTVVVLLLSWWTLATIYVLPVWVIGLYVNRDLNFRRSWKFSGAALLPGALLLTAGIMLYDFGAMDLVQFGFLFGSHLVLGWIYLFVSLLFVPAISTSMPKGNPFVTKIKSDETGQSEQH